MDELVEQHFLLVVEQAGESLEHLPCLFNTLLDPLLIHRTFFIFVLLFFFTEGFLVTVTS